MSCKGVIEKISGSVRMTDPDVIPAPKTAEANLQPTVNNKCSPVNP